MNCEDFESVASDLACEHMMEAALREDAMLHRSTCEGCATRLYEEQRLTNALRQVSSMMQTQKASPRVEEHLLAEFRSVAAVRGASRTGTSNRYGVFAAVAAALLLAVGAVVIRGLITRPELPQPVQAKHLPPEQPRAGVKESLPPPAVKLPKLLQASGKQAKHSALSKTGRKATRGNLETGLAGNNNPEIATEFLPIGYAPVLNVQEGAQLVRVEMPRSAMARFGLPVNMDRYDERVKADVLFSADGMARAIRFVQ